MWYLPWLNKLMTSSTKILQILWTIWACLKPWAGMHKNSQMFIKNIKYKVLNLNCWSDTCYIWCWYIAFTFYKRLPFPYLAGLNISILISDANLHTEENQTVLLARVVIFTCSCVLFLLLRCSCFWLWAYFWNLLVVRQDWTELTIFPYHFSFWIMIYSPVSDLNHSSITQTPYLLLPWESCIGKCWNISINV